MHGRTCVHVHRQCHSDTNDVETQKHHTMEEKVLV